MALTVSVALRIFLVVVVVSVLLFAFSTHTAGPVAVPVPPTPRASECVCPTLTCPPPPPPPPPPSVKPPVKPPPPVQCMWTFHQYQPSKWEKKWSSNIVELSTRVCAELAAEHSQSVELVTSSLHWTNMHPSDSERLQASHLDIFSLMIWKQECSDVPGRALAYGVQLIEPLIGMTRDPLTICSPIPATPSVLRDVPLGDLVQSKRHIVFAPSAPWVVLSDLVLSHEPLLAQSWTVGSLPPWYRRASSDRKTLGPMPDSIIFDLGASYFSMWGGDTSAASSMFLSQQLRSRGLSVSRHFAYEYERLDPSRVWDLVPEDYMAVYTMINHGVEVSGKYNPWNVLTAVAKPEDFVLIKLDIDTAHLENPLMNQLLTESPKRRLVDEMTYEHHVDIPEMRGYWGAGLPETLADTYRIFGEMRNHGVRMHSWP